MSVTIPVLNEEAQLARSVQRLGEFLTAQGRFRWEIVIANNGSNDRTREIAEQLAKDCHSVRVHHLEQKGRGGALKKAWLEGEADVLSYMDVDLSTDLAAFPPLVDALNSGQFDLAIGSRLLPQSQIERGWQRELISRSYNWLVKGLLHTHFSDAQCGFKAIRRQAAHALLPLVEDTRWFFDTELLVLAEKLGYGICELPVLWVEDPDSRVKIFRTAIEDIKGLIRLKRNFARGKYELHRLAVQAAGAAAPVIREAGGRVA